MIRYPLAVLAVALAAVPAAAAPTDEQEAVARVNRAIDRGKNFLKSKYHPNSKWELFWLSNLANYPGGTTALAALAMLTAGERPDAEPVRSALDYLRTLPQDKTYVVALVTMALAEARQPADRTRIASNARWLIDRASRDNAGRIRGWGYPTELGGRPDGSNTQYALLGLYAAKQAGVAIEDAVWTQIRDLYTASQKPDGPTAGFWHYTPEKPDPSFTMTAAGVSGLVIAGMALGDEQQQLDPATGVAANCGRYAENDKLARGMNWLGKMFNWDGRPSDNGTWQYYNTYGIERVGRLSGQRFIGRIDWYRDGCTKLVESQRPDGSWTRDGPGLIDASPVMATSFALLFLSKGRTPVLVSKLAHGESVMTQDRVLVEKGEPGGVVGWNRKHNDARNLTEFASRELFSGLPLGWQVYDPRRRPFERNDDILAEVGTLVQSPVLYLNGHRRPVLGGQQREIFKRYIEEGGFVLAEACCGNDDFAAGFRSLMEDLFPDNVLKPMPPQHPIWKSFYAVPPGEFPKLECLERGCRTVVVFSPEPLAGYWEEARYMPKGKEPAANRGQQAYRLAGNVIAYATGMEPPKQKLSFTKIVDGAKDAKSPPGGFVKPAQLKLRDEPPPAPAAMRNLMGYLRDAVRLDVVPDKESMAPSDADLFKYRFLYLHGRKEFSFDDAERANLKAALLGGGVLFADACCGSPTFDASFREMVAKTFPDKKLELIPDGDDLYSKELNGAAIRTVKRREKADGAGPDGGFKDLPPYLEGIKVDGRWVVIYSKYDVGCALEGHKATDCLGHTRESALQLAAAAVLYSLMR